MSVSESLSIYECGLYDTVTRPAPPQVGVGSRTWASNVASAADGPGLVREHSSATKLLSIHETIVGACNSRCGEMMIQGPFKLRTKLNATRLFDGQIHGSGRPSCTKSMHTAVIDGAAVPPAAVYAGLQNGAQGPQQMHVLVMCLLTTAAGSSWCTKWPCIDLSRDIVMVNSACLPSYPWFHILCPFLHFWALVCCRVCHCVP